MTAVELRLLLLSHFPGAVITVLGKDANFSVEIVTPEFENINNLNRKKKVLSAVKEQISSGVIHSFSVQAYTHKEWQQDSNSLIVL